MVRRKLSGVGVGEVAWERGAATLVVAVETAFKKALQKTFYHCYGCPEVEV